MSLVVHLPLNGDLKQQGLSNKVATNNGATVNTSGKIGQCYSFNGSSNYITLPQGYFGAKWSYAVWVYTTSTSAIQNLGCCRTAAGSGFSIFLLGGKIRIDPGGNQVMWTTGYTFPVNTWFHLTVTCNNGAVKYYINGEYKESYTATVSSSYWGNNFSAGASQANGSGYGNYLNGRLNDIRIYDHCLSPMEVKQLSQGLVLHYPLNRGGWGQENLYTASRDFSGSWVNGSIWTTSSEKYLGFTVKQKSTVWGGISQNITCTNGDIFTISFYAKVDSGGEIISVHRSSLGNVTTGLTLLDGNFSSSNVWVTKSENGTQWKRYWATLKITSSDITYLQWRIENDIADKNLYLCGFKLEKGDRPTPWCPNSADALYATMGINNNIEYDCSGFGNNGEYYAYDSNGSITYTSDTPKFNTSTHIASGSATANSATGTRYLYGHCALTNPTEMSVAFWLKPISGGYNGTTSHGYFCTTTYEYGYISVGSDYQGSAMNNRDSAIDINDSSSTTQCRVIFQPTLGEWHHYVITYDGQVGRVYTDGVQTSSAQFSSARALDSFIGVVLGFSKAGGVWRKNDACYSDFRIYATALSADDVKDLYNNAAYIDNQSNVYAADYIETSNTALNSQGVFNTLEINEETEQAMIKDSGELYSPDFYEI